MGGSERKTTCPAAGWWCVLAWCSAVAIGGELWADAPQASYIFPAGGQRGTRVAFHVGGVNLHQRCGFELLGPGIVAPSTLERATQRVWFEGPVIPIPDSQRAEDYPWPQQGELAIASDAPAGPRLWRITTSQGVTPTLKFMVGELPEIVEQEIDGQPIATPVQVPVTINGRIFPREDSDIWTFQAEAGRAYTCEVHAARLGSPLDARLEVLGPDGMPIATNDDAIQADPRLGFTAPRTGTYQVRIHDVHFGGLQHYVYRLTIDDGPYVEAVYPLGGRRGTALNVELIGQNLPAVSTVTLDGDGDSQLVTLPLEPRASNPFRLALSDAAEWIEGDSNDTTLVVTAPCVVNGRISVPGEIDTWFWQAVKDQVYELELQAARLGSPLASVLTIADDSGDLATNDDLAPGQSDSRLQFKAPRDGVFRVTVRDQFRHRGGDRFAYRLHLRQAQTPSADFALQLSADGLTVPLGGEAKLKLTCERTGAFDGLIALQFDGLPSGVSVEPSSIEAKKNEVQLTIKAAGDSTIAASAVRIRGEALIGETMVTRQAATRAGVLGDAGVDHVCVAVAAPTPFKVVGDFETRYAARGSTYVRHYRIERGGYEGPLTIQLAESQARHLQGVTGPTMVVPAGQSEFDYPVHLAPWMEIGRTSRTCVSAIGIVEDAAGGRHTVSYTSHAQNDQIVVLVDPGQLAVQLDQDSLLAQPGSQSIVRIHIDRGTSIRAQIRVKLVVPEHIQGVHADPIVLGPADTDGAMTIRFAQENLGPWNMPLVIRAETQVDGLPYTAESPLEIVAPQQP